MPEEQERWSRFLAGDELSFRQIYEVHYTLLHSYASKLTKDVHLADECIQDLFIKLWRNRAKLTTPEAPKNYLLRAIRNVVYNKLQQQGRSSTVSIEEVPEIQLGQDSPEILFQGQLPLSPLVTKLMKLLTDRQREAVYLFYVESLSYQEIGAHFQIQTKAAYKLIYRAIDTLRDELKVR